MELRTSDLHPDDLELLDSGVPVVCVALYTRDVLDGPEPRVRRISRPR